MLVSGEERGVRHLYLSALGAFSSERASVTVTVTVTVTARATNVTSPSVANSVCERSNKTRKKAPNREYLDLLNTGAIIFHF